MRRVMLSAAVLIAACEGVVSGEGRDDLATSSASLGERARVVSQHSGLCLSAAASDGALVTQESCATSTEIEERVVGTGLVELRPGGGARCIEMPGSSRNDLTQAVLWPCWGGANQRFVVTELGGGLRTYRNQNSGKCLDISSWSTASGAALVQYSCHGGANQQFKPGTTPAPVQPPAPTTQGLKAMHSGLCVRAASVAEGQPLTQDACSPAFDIEARSVGNAVELRPRGSSLCIEMPGSSTSNFTQAVLWPCWGGGNQQWIATSVGDGSASYRNVNSGKCLDILSGSTSAGAQLIQYDCHSGANQHFTMGSAPVMPTAPVVPVTPPVTPPSSSANTVQAVIDDMRQPELATARPNSKPSVIFSGNFAQTQLLAPAYASSVNNITSWFWIFQLPGNTATNVAVEVRGQEAYALRSGGQWVKVNDGRSSGWRGNFYGASYELQDEEVVDARTIRVRPGAAPRTDLVSYELWTSQGEVFSWFTDVRAVFATGEARLVALNPAGQAELASARYAAQIGFDLWRRGIPLQSGVSVFDGSVGRMKPITTTWQPFNVISLKPNDPSWSTLPGYATTGPAWTVVNPYVDPPYTLSEAEIRANPPPLK